jgi:hypothetical protein
VVLPSTLLSSAPLAWSLPSSAPLPSRVLSSVVLPSTLLSSAPLAWSLLSSTPLSM